VKITDLRTPCVLVDHPRTERNIDRMQRLADRGGMQLRPHAKTHKRPDLAALQIARGASGICCAKLGEAEVFADAGVQDIRLAYPIHPSNADRVLALLERVRLSFIVDHLEVAHAWSDAMTRAGRTADVLAKVDVGFHRCGIVPADAAAFLQRVSGMPGLRLRGVLSHAGHAYGARSEEELERIAAEEAHDLLQLAAEARASGIDVEEISVGATPTARFSAAREGLTELRPGNYVYFDRTQVLLGAASWTDCALTVLARVVSCPSPARVIFDAGSKTLTSDPARGFEDPKGHGVVFRSLEAAEPDERLIVERLSEEHATVALAGGATFQPGDLVRIVQNHACVVANMVDEVWLVDDQTVLDRMPVAARGRIQ
jgi:D-serine deaminase-like pyridoxal phosphate-dependent protein